MRFCEIAFITWHPVQRDRGRRTAAVAEHTGGDGAGVAVHVAVHVEVFLANSLIVLYRLHATWMLRAAMLLSLIIFIKYLRRRGERTRMRKFSYFLLKRFHCPSLISPLRRSPLLKLMGASFPCRKRAYMYRKSLRNLSMVIFVGSRLSID